MHAIYSRHGSVDVSMDESEGNVVTTHVGRHGSVDVHHVDRNRADTVDVASGLDGALVHVMMWLP